MAGEKDRLTNAIMALMVGAVVLLSRDFIDLMLDSMSTWIGEWFTGWGGPGGVVELLFRLLFLVIVIVVGGILLVILWILSGLNQIYALPFLALLISYATPWPFRLGFLNPVPYVRRAGRWGWDLLVLSTYGEYLRRGRGKNIVFVILPLVGMAAVAIGLWGLFGSTVSNVRLRFPTLSSLAVMPGGRTVYVDRAVDTKLTAGIKLEKVILGRAETKLRFRFWTTYPPWTKISISRTAALSPRSYLLDNQGKRYSVIGSEGMEFGRRYDLMIRENRYGTLIFEPLRPGVQSFNLHFHSIETGEDWVAKQVEVR